MILQCNEKKNGIPNFFITCRWKIPVLVDKAPITMRRDDASEIERKRIFDSSRQEVISR